MEFVRNALDGLGGVSYDMELIEEFLECCHDVATAGKVVEALDAKLLPEHSVEGREPRTDR